MENGKSNKQHYAKFGKTPNPRPQYKGVITESLYVPMRDGVKIALDVMRPKNASADLKLPAILIMARYWRSFALRGLAPPGRAPFGPRAPLPDFLLGNGYAVVAVDSRGSGAPALFPLAQPLGSSAHGVMIQLESESHALQDSQLAVARGEPGPGHDVLRQQLVHDLIAVVEIRDGGS